MPPTSAPLPNTTSGITTTPSGVRHIPSSIRADGSTRKEIKVRPGYRPPEDVEVYKNRTAEAWKTRGKGGVPGAEGLQDNNSRESQEQNNSTKNAKRREARKKAKATAGAEAEVEAKAEAEADGEEKGDGEIAAATNGGLNQQPNGSSQASASRNAGILQKENWRPEVEPVDPAIEKEKQLRALKKKLRQARELREKKDNGEDLLPEQFEKVIKINELIRQLDGLGFNAEGEPKRA